MFEIGKGKIHNFKKSTKPSIPTEYSGAISLPPIKNSFMYIETSQKNSGTERIFVSFVRTQLIQISNNSFYFNRFSMLNIDSLKSSGRFRLQLLSEDNI